LKVYNGPRNISTNNPKTRQVLPAPTKGGKLQMELEEQVLIKSWKEGGLADQLQPKLKGPYPVILAMPMAVKVQGIDSWFHLSRVKRATVESTSDQAQPGDTAVSQ
jgi:hypothetical protein